MAGNLTTSLARRRREQPMQAYDRLPHEVRHWLHAAALPWSAASVLRLWRRALAEAKGDAKAARARLDRAEARLLARDAARVWGAGHPAARSDQYRANDSGQGAQRP
jgi:Family of unknown function (DUF6525)